MGVASGNASSTGNIPRYGGKSELRVLHKTRPPGSKSSLEVVTKRSESESTVEKGQSNSGGRQDQEQVVCYH